MMAFLAKAGGTSMTTSSDILISLANSEGMIAKARAASHALERVIGIGGDDVVAFDANGKMP